MEISIKCSDISNPCRPWPQCLVWANLVCFEFFRQGDRERLQWDLEPTAAMDRRSACIPAIQKGFMLCVVRPLFDALHTFFASPLTATLLANLDVNLKHWQSALDAISVPGNIRNQVIPPRQSQQLSQLQSQRQQRQEQQSLEEETEPQEKTDAGQVSHDKAKSFSLREERQSTKEKQKNVAETRKVFRKQPEIFLKRFFIDTNLLVFTYLCFGEFMQLHIYCILVRAYFGSENLLAIVRTSSEKRAS
ncbi:unnamed protein product [Protopolystoma xenopodis]|uniref:PDEase domain-containing protein n=1 Tax=Protopolystoma xenopodis TaxID=117903 RepID=A0A448WG52_9PLAT|nr:unnamed protein product [Protopolystoma xenopodis]